MVFMTSGAQNLKQRRREKKVGDHQGVCHLASGGLLFWNKSPVITPSKQSGY